MDITLVTQNTLEGTSPLLSKLDNTLYNQRLAIESIYFRYIILFLLIHCATPIHLIGQYENKKYENKTCLLCKAGIHHPQHESPYQDISFKKELPFVGSLVGLVTTSFLIATPTPLTTSDILQLDGQTINSFDRYAISKNSKKAQQWSDLFLFGVAVLPTIFLSNHHTRKDIFPLLIMSAEIVGINYALTIITKKLVRRTRPLAYNPAFPLEEKTTENARASFFSGHTSHTAALSFLTAKVIMDYHPEAKAGLKVGIWAFAASIPALTGYLRIRAGKHFPTDTIVGYLAGGLVGIIIPTLHKPHHHHRLAKRVKIQPALGIGTASVRVSF